VRRAYHSSRGFLPRVVYLSVIVKPLQRGGPDSLEAVAQRGTGGGVKGAGCGEVNNIKMNSRISYLLYMEMEGL
jgi:hypothetical protein